MSIKITPEMIAAGIDALRSLDWEVDTREEIVTAVYLAMASAGQFKRGRLDHGRQALTLAGYKQARREV